MNDPNVTNSYSADLNSAATALSRGAGTLASVTDHTDEVLVWDVSKWNDQWARDPGLWILNNPVPGSDAISRPDVPYDLVTIATPDAVGKSTLYWMRRTRIVQMSYDPAIIAADVRMGAPADLVSYMKAGVHDLVVRERGGVKHFHHHVGETALYANLIPLLMSAPGTLLNLILADPAIKTVYEVWNTTTQKWDVTPTAGLTFSTTNPVNNFHIEPLDTIGLLGCHAGTDGIAIYKNGVKMWR